MLRCAPLPLLVLAVLLLCCAEAGKGRTPCATVPLDEASIPLRADDGTRPCAKIIYLHVPKCGGSSVMAALLPLGRRGVRVLRYKSEDSNRKYNTYRNGRLLDEFKAEAARPRRVPRKVIEIHVDHGSYLSLHPHVLRLREAYEKAGCRVALATLVREPASLAKSWFTYCSKRWTGSKGKRFQKYMPPYWSYIRACNRKNVMTTFLTTGEFCGGGRPYTASAADSVGEMLASFDLLDDISNLPAWLARVFHFLGEDKCVIPAVNVHKSRLREETLRLDLGIPIPGIKERKPFCGWSQKMVVQAASLAKAARAAGNVTLSDEQIDEVIAMDKRLYNKLQPLFPPRSVAGEE